jgi:hypothetical protein
VLNAQGLRSTAPRPDGAVFRRALGAGGQLGWEPVDLADIPSYVSLTPSAGQVEPFLRVSEGYVGAYVPRDYDLHIGFAGFLFGRDGILYGSKAGELSHMRYRCVERSSDGGVSWQDVWGGGAFSWEPATYAWDGCDFVCVTGTALTGEQATSVGPWALDPIDPLCLYAVQQGRGRLFRTLDSGQTWAEVATPFAPDLPIDGVGVDSLATVYLRTSAGCFRLRQTPHPVRLSMVDAVPDTLTKGQAFSVRARLAPRRGALPPGRMVAEYNGQTELHDEGLAGDVRAGAGVYSGQLTVASVLQPGYYHVDDPLGFCRVPVCDNGNADPARPRKPVRRLGRGRVGRCGRAAVALPVRGRRPQAG